MKLIKGSYGYRRKHFLRNLTIVLLWIIIIIIQAVLGRTLHSASLRVLFTMTSILSVLPMANIASPMLAMFRYKTPPHEEYLKVKAFENRGCILYELILTNREAIVPVDYCCIYEGCAYMFISLPAIKNNQAVNRLIQFIADQSEGKAEYRLFFDFDDYLTALKKIPDTIEKRNILCSESLKNLFLQLTY